MKTIKCPVPLQDHVAEFSVVFFDWVVSILHRKMLPEMVLEILNFRTNLFCVPKCCRVHENDLAQSRDQQTAASHVG